MASTDDKTAVLQLSRGTRAGSELESSLTWRFLVWHVSSHSSVQRVCASNSPALYHRVMNSTSQDSCTVTWEAASEPLSLAEVGLTWAQTTDAKCSSSGAKDQSILEQGAKSLSSVLWELNSHLWGYPSTPLVSRSPTNLRDLQSGVIRRVWETTDWWGKSPDCVIKSAMDPSCLKHIDRSLLPPAWSLVRLMTPDSSGQQELLPVAPIDCRLSRPHHPHPLTLNSGISSRRGAPFVPPSLVLPHLVVQLLDLSSSPPCPRLVTSLSSGPVPLALPHHLLSVLLPLFLSHWPRSPSQLATETDSSLSPPVKPMAPKESEVSSLLWEGRGQVGSLVSVGVGEGLHGWKWWEGRGWVAKYVGWVVSECRGEGWVHEGIGVGSNQVSK